MGIDHLSLAISSQNLDLIDHLLAHYDWDSSNQRPMHQAIVTGRIDIIDRLLVNGIIGENPEDHLSTAIERDSSLELIDRLCSVFPIEILGTVTSSGSSPFALAIERGNREVIALFYQLGTKENLYSCYRFAPSSAEQINANDPFTISLLEFYQEPESLIALFFDILPFITEPAWSSIIGSILVQVLEPPQLAILQEAGVFDHLQQLDPQLRFSGHFPFSDVVVWVLNNLPQVAIRSFNCLWNPVDEGPLPQIINWIVEQKLDPPVIVYGNNGRYDVTAHFNYHGQATNLLAYYLLAFSWSSIRYRKRINMIVSAFPKLITEEFIAPNGNISNSLIIAINRDDVETLKLLLSKLPPQLITHPVGDHTIYYWAVNKGSAKCCNYLRPFFSTTRPF